MLWPVEAALTPVSSSKMQTILNGMLFSVGNYSFLREDFKITFWRSKGDPVGTVTTWQGLWFPCHPLREGGGVNLVVKEVLQSCPEGSHSGCPG